MVVVMVIIPLLIEYSGAFDFLKQLFTGYNSYKLVLIICHRQGGKLAFTQDTYYFKIMLVDIDLYQRLTRQVPGNDLFF